jgi:hypothetical protein
MFIHIFSQIKMVTYIFNQKNQTMVTYFLLLKAAIQKLMIHTIIEGNTSWLQASRIQK